MFFQIFLAFAFLFFLPPTLGENGPVKSFLQYIYGQEGIEFAKFAMPHEDGWMLPGPKNTNALAIIESGSYPQTNGVFTEIIGSDLVFGEVINGKVDPAFALSAVYTLQRQLAISFLYSALSGNERMLARLCTDPQKVEVSGPTTRPGDLDQFTAIIQILPVVRSGTPSDDAVQKAVTYRVPLGETVLTLKLVKQGSTWKVDSSKGVKISSAPFYKSAPRRPVQYGR